MRFVNKEMVVGKGVGVGEGPEDPKKAGGSFGPVLSSSLRQLTIHSEPKIEGCYNRVLKVLFCTFFDRKHPKIY